MAHRLLSSVVLSLLCSISFAQQWQKPEECSPEAKEQVRQALAIAAAKQKTFLNAHSAGCSSDFCPSVRVQVTMQGNMCVASVTTGLIRVLPGGPVDIRWSLLATGPCAAPNQCRFDNPTGITILSNQGIPFGNPVIGATSVGLPDLNNSTVRKPIAGYEPHVWLTTIDGVSRTCCPIDPKIINDN